MKRLSWVVVAATLAGLAAGLWAIGRAGLHEIAHVLARLGAVGALLIAASSLVVLLALGAAWNASLPAREPRRLWLFAWGRAAREAANDLLPFSQLGGLVVGLRTVIAGGVAPAAASVATVIDLVTEILSQVTLSLYALAVFGALLAGGNAALTGLAWLGVAMGLSFVAAVTLLQGPALRRLTPLIGRLLPESAPTLEQVAADLAAFTARPAAILPPLLWNLAAWLLAIGTAWLMLWLLQAPLPFVHVLGLEVLIFALRSSAFVVPGALGVQEAGYALLGPLFGLDRETAVALSLVKRARDIGIGVPTLLLWQWQELRRGKR